MKKGLSAFLLTTLLSLPQPLHASLASAQATISDIESIGIDEKTSQEIKELYDELTSAIKKADTAYTEYKSKLRDNAQKMKDKEQSTENKLIGAAGIGATGIGGMQALSGLAEQGADDDAERDMRAYLATFTCDFGQGRNTKGGKTNIELPGGNELIALRQEYMALAADLQERKAALDTRPGIEAELILDIAQTGLYDDVGIGKTDGAYTSVARALTDENGADAAEWAQQTDDTKSQIKTGATVAAVGAVGSAVANLVANKNAPKEESAKITTEYEAQKAKIESEVNDAEKRLNRAIEQNAQKIDEYNKLLAQHKQFIESANDSECAAKVSPDYIAYINSLSTIENNLQDTSNLTIAYNLATQQALYQECMSIKQQREDCNATPGKEWNGTKCVDKPTPAPEPDTSHDNEQSHEFEDPALENDTPNDESGDEFDDEYTDDTTDGDEGTAEQTDDPVTDPDQCPAHNPRMKSLNENNRVGDFCRYGNVSQGQVYKRKDGTCSCTAVSCVAGYHVSKGMCVANTSDAAGNCVRQSYPENSENNTMPKCVAFCQSKATANKCKYTGATIRHSTKECICNPANINKTCAKQEYKLPNAQTSCATLCSQKNAALECDPTGKSLKKTKSDGSQWCVCNATDDDIQLKYYEVCGKDKGKTGKTEYCISNVFNWTNVQLMQAAALAQEYARVKNNHTIKCAESYRTDWNDDYVKCATTNGSAYYEFKFDDVKESIDTDLQASLKKAICQGIYGGSMIGGYACNSISQATCTGNMAATAKKMGYSVQWDSKYNYCNFDGIEKKGNTAIKKIDGIDSFIFYSGIQIQANTTIEGSLRDYVRGIMGARLKSFSCVKNPRQMSKIEGHSVKGTTDDVLRCTINGNQEIDFVFDDMSEFSTTYHEGGMQNIDCKVVGGEYNGRECMYLGKAQCEKLQNINSAKCPTCQTIYWDGKDNVCRLPSAEAAKDLENNIEMGTLAAAAIGGIVVTVFTAGTAAPVLALLAVETAGAGIEMYSTHQMHQAGDQFLADSRKCQSATCAESMLKSDLQRMANLANDLPDAQVNGIDAELARLAGLIPTDSTFYRSLLANGTDAASNQKGFFDAQSWEPEQIWRAVGITMQLASLAKSIWGWAAKKLTRTTGALRRGASQAYDASRALPPASGTDDAFDASRAIGDGTPPKSGGPQSGGAPHNASSGADDATGAANHAGTSNSTRTGNSATNNGNGGARASGTTGAHSGATLSKAEKLAAAKRAKRAGYHGSDADIADTQNIRWSKGSHPSGMFDGVSIAHDRHSAENYAINRLVKNQNPHLTNSNFLYDQTNNVLIITSDTPLKLDNKTFYIYELAADSDDWLSVSNQYVGKFRAHYNKSKTGTEWLSKESVNLDDLIRQGRIKINAPSY